MAYALNDGVRLHYEETGTGFPILFIHEFAGDHRSWEPQVRHFSRRYRCITYDARGYPSSDVPDDPEAYSQDHAVADAIAVLDAAGVEKAHVVGLSMGGFCTLHVGLRHPERAASLTVAGCGYGADPDKNAAFRAECERVAESYRTRGSRGTADWYGQGPARVQFQNKDPRGWAEFDRVLAEHSDVGARLTQLGVQRLRPSLYDLRGELAALQVPTLIISGDEDDACLDVDIMLKRTIPASGLAVFPKTGHTINLEEPDLFNRTVTDFLTAVENDAWPVRDPRAISASTTGVK